MSKPTKIIIGPKVCQDCKHHVNNPSRCTVWPNNVVYIPRKEAACPEFKGN